MMPPYIREREMDKQKKELSIAILLCSVYLTVLCTENLGDPSTLSPSIVSPACTTLIPNRPTPTNKPRITIEHPTANLGKVRPNKQYTCSFPFKNAGNALLEIKGIQSTCQCSTPELEKKKYAPGESGTIVVHFQSSPLEGSTSKRLYVLSNASDSPRAMLTIKADVVVPWEVVPHKIELDYRAAEFGIVPITVRSKDGTPFRITHAASPNNAITLSPGPDNEGVERITRAASSDNAITLSPDPDNEGVEHVLRLKVNAELIKKGESGRIVIKTTHPEFTILSVPYTMRPEFEVFPRRIIFFNVRSQEPSVRHITVTNNYGEDFKITLVKSLKGHMKVLGFERENATAKVTVECLIPESATPRYFGDDIEIRINESRVYRVPCNVWIGEKR
jgi:hypothetical protein